MKNASRLVFTEEMKRVRTAILKSPLNKEQYETRPKAVKVLDFEGYSFFLYIPLCVAGWSAPADSYRAIEEGEHLIENELPLGSELIAWYGWGGSGWIAQVKPQSSVQSVRNES